MPEKFGLLNMLNQNQELKSNLDRLNHKQKLNKILKEKALFVVWVVRVPALVYIWYVGMKIDESGLLCVRFAFMLSIVFGIISVKTNVSEKLNGTYNGKMIPLIL